MEFNRAFQTAIYKLQQTLSAQQEGEWGNRGARKSFAHCLSEIRFFARKLGRAEKKNYRERRERKEQEGKENKRQRDIDHQSFQALLKYEYIPNVLL